MFGVLCESDEGMDVFGNPKGKMILMESCGEMLDKHKAIARAQELKASGKFGDVKVVFLDPCTYILD